MLSNLCRSRRDIGPNLKVVEFQAKPRALLGLRRGTTAWMPQKVIKIKTWDHCDWENQLTEPNPFSSCIINFLPPLVSKFECDGASTCHIFYKQESKAQFQAVSLWYSISLSPWIMLCPRCLWTIINALHLLLASFTLSLLFTIFRITTWPFPTLPTTKGKTISTKLPYSLLGFSLPRAFEFFNRTGSPPRKARRQDQSRFPFCPLLFVTLSALATDNSYLFNFIPLFCTLTYIHIHRFQAVSLSTFSALCLFSCFPLRGLGRVKSD